MSPSMIQNLRLPPDAPKRLQAWLFIERFLIHHNKLDGWLALAAVAWGSMTLIFSGFWGAWPVTQQLNSITHGNPWMLSVSLLLAGIGSYVSRYMMQRSNLWLWTSMRSASALLAFASWMILVLIFLSVEPIFTPGVVCYGLFAFGKAISYIGFVIQLDRRKQGDERSLG